MSEIENNQGLQRGLKNRHIQMIALGGCIGTGLFLGSATAIRMAGPAILLAYMMGGFVIYMIMRMLGEMSTEEPVAGAFSHFAYKYWGPFPGFLAGWNYWLLYILVCMAELSAVGVYVEYWIPGFPHWITALTVLIVVACVNLVSVKAFGEFEFWFAIVKVLAVIGMIIFGIVLISIGLTKADSTVRISNLWVHGGFMPMGIGGVLLSLVVVMFSFGGTELIGITAGEADDPKKSIPRAIRQVMWRVLIFYIGALAVIMILIPWNHVGEGKSPFVLIFESLGITGAAHLLNVVIFTAAISVYNSGIYSNGRMLYGLAEQGNAPKVFLKLSKNRIPYVGVIFSSICTLAAVLINFMVPAGAFMQVMAFATAAATITWAMIVLTQLRFRRQQKDPSKLIFRSPFFPYVNYICLSFLALLVGMMFYIDGTRRSAMIIPVWLVVMFVAFTIKTNADKKRKTAASGS